jgi:putative membrane protein
VDGHALVNLNDALANDRTFLAWFRTGLALYAFGFVVAKVAFLIKSDPKGLSDRDLYTIVGVLTVLCGAAIILIGYWQHRAVVRAEASEDDGPPARWPITVTLVAVAGSLLLSALILVTT